MSNHFFRRLRSHERGATAIEYGIFAALIGLGITGALYGTKNNINKTYACISASFRTMTACGQSPADQTREAILNYLLGAIPNRELDTAALNDPIRDNSTKIGGGLMQSLGSEMFQNPDGTFFRHRLCNADGACMNVSYLENGSNTYIETAPGSKTYYNASNIGLMLYKADDGSWYGTITKPKA